MHVVLLSPIPYHFLHQRPQEIADRLQSRGISVTYVQPDGWREYVSGNKKGFGRALFLSFIYHVLGLFSLVRRKFVAPGMRKRKAGDRSLQIVTLPLTIPINKTNSWFFDTLNAAIFGEFIRRNIFSGFDRNETNVAIVQHPFWGSVLRRGDFSKIFYDCIDELKIFAGRNSIDRFTRYERDLVEMAEGIFVTAKKLAERLSGIRRGVPLYRVPNGVDAGWFENVAGRDPVPVDVREIRKPIVGYVGALYVWLDYKLLEYAAASLPEVSFVLVGPEEFPGVLRRFLSRPNCFWTGVKRHEEIPSYIESFDVCMIPFKEGDISKSTNPVKLFEYFALGKPVVTTPIDELESYRPEGLVYWAENAEDFVRCIASALAENDDRKRELRKSVARRNSWDDRISTIVSAMDAPR